KADRHFFSDDNALTKQIESTNAIDAEELDVRPVLSIIEDILRLAKPATFDTTIQVSLHILTSIRDPDQDSEIVKLLAYPINRISSEIICKCAAGGESHSVTMELLQSLSHYAWDAKVVITFAAFAINYGEFWLIEQLHTKNALARNIAALKDLPDILAHAGELRKKFEDVLDLLTAVIKVTHCIVEFKELPSKYISRQAPEITEATGHIPTAVYWVIRSLLVCAATLLNLVGTGHECISSPAESWEIRNLAHKLSVILEHLHKQLRVCKELIDQKKTNDKFNEFVSLTDSVHIDNMKVLRAIVHAREDQGPLYDPVKKTNVPLEMLRLKYVLLLITDLKIPHEEINILHLIYNQRTMRDEYEVLWLPVVDPTTPITQSQEAAFYSLRNNTMPWYSVDHPSLVDPVAIRYIKNRWMFESKPILVVLNPQGKPSNIDALPMMWIWGSTAFDFTRNREYALWQESNWNIDLLAVPVDSRIPEWIGLNKVICLYGGEDIEWIRRFTQTARSVANALNVPLEMLYVGKREPKEKTRRCHEIIQREGLSHIFPLKDYSDYVWFFWVRLTSMWNSKKQIGMTENDEIMQEIKDMLVFDSSEQGWAVFSRGNQEITKGNGEKVIQVLENSGNWMYKVDQPEKFVAVLHEEVSTLQPEHHCNRLILPGQGGNIPEIVKCSECGKTMDKYVMYRCCTD
ncbi:hypothetical protein M569_02915, partial [Genlisea aurea]